MNIASSAPELFFDTEHLSTAVDVWSIGCVLAELVIGIECFKAESEIKVLERIIKYHL